MMAAMAQKQLWSHLVLSLACFLAQGRGGQAAHLVYTALGEDFKYQPYIWLSLHQARLFNPTLPIHLILNNNDLMQDKTLKVG